MCTINDFHSNIPKLVVVYFQESKVVSSKKVKINQFDAYMQVRLNETVPLIQLCQLVMAPLVNKHY